MHSIVSGTSFTGIKDFAGNVAREVAGVEIRDPDHRLGRAAIFMTENLLIVGL